MANVRPIRPRIKVASIPSPTGGWNARDAYSDMPITDAVSLTNYYPRTTSVALRNGHSRHSTGLSGQSETLMAYAGGSSNKLFSVNASGNIYDVTSSGAVGAAAVTGLTNGRFQYINVATTANNYIMAVNGADKARFYTGSAWAADGDGAPYDITGVDTATCIGINLHKNRVWLVKQNTLTAWYLPTGAIGGAASSLDLRAFAPHGGGLVAMATWTIDGGAGVDDFAVFITNKGDVIVYQGTDPSSATTWALRGSYYLGPPVGNRPFFKMGGDLLLILRDGVFPLSQALASASINHKSAITDKIQQAVGAAIETYGSNFGWQLMLFPQQDMVILNVPINTGASQEQYVMNTITGAWAQFQGWEANCWEIFNNDLYFGGNTYVGKAWDTNGDNGSAINGFILQAFSEFGAPGQRKRATSMRPMFLTNGTPTIFGSINWDYNLANPTAALSTTSTNFGVWDTAVWDTSIWGGGLNPSYEIQSVTGSGWAGAPVFKSASLGLQIELVSNAVSVEVGGFL